MRTIMNKGDHGGDNDKGPEETEWRMDSIIETIQCDTLPALVHLLIPWPWPTFLSHSIPFLGPLLTSVPLIPVASQHLFFRRFVSGIRRDAAADPRLTVPAQGRTTWLSRFYCVHWHVNDSFDWDQGVGNELGENKYWISGFGGKGINPGNRWIVTKPRGKDGIEVAQVVDEGGGRDAATKRSIPSWF